MNSVKTFHISTLGCKINQYESQSIREAWTSVGYAETADPAGADIILLNSCAVTAQAVRDLRQRTRKLSRTAPQARIIITGCAAQVMQDDLAKDFSDALIVPQSSKEELLTLPMAHDAPQPSCAPEPSCAQKQADGADTAAPHFPEFSITGYNRVRAVVKVQDGCTHRCTYCIIPSTRGASVSRPMQGVADEVRRLFEAGWHEATLSGINLRQFGRDLPGSPDFWDLLEYLERELAPDWAGSARLRISSLDPAQLTDRALEVLAASRLTSPQLHISLQSLAPAVLRRMGRGHYGPDEVAAWVERLRGVWPLFGLGTDLIAGFPGETDEDFRQTLAACRALPLSYAHVFPYSQRPGTPAARYPNQVPQAVKKDRARLLREVAADKKAAFLATLAGQERLDVVLEKLSPARGICQYYADCRFTADVPGGALRRMVAARPVGVDGTTLLVQPAECACSVKAPTPMDIAGKGD